jgi:hypothetical protein
MSAQIHMDVEAAHAAQSAMNSAWEKISNAFEDAKTATDGIRNQGKWICPDHLTFIDLWMECASGLKTDLETLADLKDRLGKEIEEWEKAASKLG